MITYLIKTIIGSILLLLVYRLVLQKEKMYVFNRFFLLFGLVFSAIAPLLSWHIDTNPDALPIATYADYLKPFNTAHFTPSTPASAQPVVFDEQSLFKVFYGIYLLTALFLLYRLLKNLYFIGKTISENKRIKMARFTVVLLPNAVVPHSFLGYIFVHKNAFEQGLIAPQIWTHEETHLQQWHSLDVVLAELMQVFFWFNPAVWLYRKAILLNHELLADEQVVQKYQNVRAYQHLLLQSIQNQQDFLLVNSFNFFITKTRIVMMHKNAYPARAFALKVASCAILLAFSVVFSDFSLAQNTAKSEKPTAKSNPVAASQNVVEEYETLVAKYVSKGVDKKGREYQRLDRPTETDRARLETLFKAMSKEQQMTQDWVMYPPFPPSPKTFITEKEYEAYKNPHVYGIWLNNRKIPNTALSKYQVNDLIRSFVSRVYKNAQPKTGYKYKFQLDLMTTAYYDNYRKNTLADTRYFLMGNREKWMAKNKK
jgi:bla regulator protein blaR1